LQCECLVRIDLSASRGQTSPNQLFGALF